MKDIHIPIWLGTLIIAGVATVVWYVTTTAFMWAQATDSRLSAHEVNIAVAQAQISSTQVDIKAIKADLKDIRTVVYQIAGKKP